MKTNSKLGILKQYGRKLGIVTFLVWIILFYNTLSNDIDICCIKNKNINHGEEIEPIDLVYTWVNGSDPEHIKLLNKYKSKDLRIVQVELNEFSKLHQKKCNYIFCFEMNSIIVTNPKFTQEDEIKFTQSSKKVLDPIFFSNLSLHSYDSIYHNKWYDMNSFVNNVTVITFNSFDFGKNYILLNQIRALLNQNFGVKYKFYMGYITLDCDSSPNCVKNLSKTFILDKLGKYPNFPKLSNSLSFKIVKSNKGSSQRGYQSVIEAKNTESEKMLIKLVESDDSYDDYDYYRANLVWDLGANKGEDYSIDKRFQDNQELKYSLRSVDMHAPWIRNIYIVTNGHYPLWLNLSNPKIKLVKHSDIFTNLSHLPTFNSQAIESHLHKIKDLSERFLYFNDDLFLGKDTNLSDFYTESKGFKFRSSLFPIPRCSLKCLKLFNNKNCDSKCFTLGCDFDGDDCKNTSLKQHHDESDSYYNAIAYTNNLFNRAYGYKIRNTPEHTPTLFDKNVMNDLQEKFKVGFDLTKSSRFRHYNNIQVQFAYFNYLLSEPKVLDKYALFDELDLDKDGLIRIQKEYKGSCLKNEKYIDKNSFIKCPELIDFMNKTNFFPKYKVEPVIKKDFFYQGVTNYEFELKLSRNFRQINDSKMLCFNDILEHKLYKQAKRSKKYETNFFDSKYPNKSQFEVN